MSFKFELGQHLKDRITGFNGIVICRTEWLHNCARHTLQPRETDKDGAPRKAEGFDEDQLEAMPKAKSYDPKAGQHLAPAHGGPMRDPERRPDASRR